MRCLLSAPEYDCGEVGCGNLLIQGDNLDALKALIPHYAGTVKCIFIDPPYNTRKDFPHYEDNLEHAQWLEMMFPRLELLSALLAKDGSIWTIIDDDEGHYLKVLMDEIFGRRNFIANVVWQKKFSPQNDAKWLSDNHDHILVYTKKKETWRPNLLPRTKAMDKRYKNPDNDFRGPWTSSDFSVKTYSENYDYPIKTPSGKVISPSPGRCWQTSRDNLEILIADNRIWFGRNNNNVPRLKKFLSEVKEGITTMTVWEHAEVGHNQEAKQEVKRFNTEAVFTTPKPERLIQRVLQLATNPGDLILDSFLGSGTTAAVAHKMDRRWIGIEMGDHAVTHCAPRLRAVIEGEPGGISKSVNWQGGGGFRFLRLGDAVFTEQGDISSALDFATLAAHLWFAETHLPLPPQKRKSAFLGMHNGIGYALLFNGIFDDKSINGGNVLNNKTLIAIRKHANGVTTDNTVVYGKGCSFGDARLETEKLTFKQIPYDCEKR